MIILGLGSNLENRQKHLFEAVELLKEIMTEINVSDIYEFDALLLDNSPESWDIPFLNMAITGKTDLPPHNLLEEIKKIERKLGRKEIYERWSPREIDIDIIAYDSLVLNDENLIIPHKDLLEREFFLLPMMDIAPDWKYPIKGACYGQTAKQLCNKHPISNSKTKKLRETGE